MQQVGIYEQLITQFIASRLDRDRFYVGERELNSDKRLINENNISSIKSCCGGNCLIKINKLQVSSN
jgi:hypothetical protein